MFYFLKVLKVNLLLIVFLLALHSFNIFSLKVFAQENYDNQSELENYYDTEQPDSYENLEATNRSKQRKSKPTKNSLMLSDSAFVADKNTTFNGLVKQVVFIVLFSLVAMAIVKFFLAKNKFHQPGSLLDDLAQKVTGAFSGISNVQTLKLKQTLMLTPGQNIYLVEIDSKKLLLGGTQQGGVQFLADLTEKADSLIKPSIENQHYTKNLIQNDFHTMAGGDFGKPIKHVELTKNINDNPFANKVQEQDLPFDEPINNQSQQLIEDIHKPQIQKQPLKRTNFRRSLSLSK